MAKKRIIKDYQDLPEEMRDAMRAQYSSDFSKSIVTFFAKNKQLVSALPYETDEISYLIKLPASGRL